MIYISDHIEPELLKLRRRKKKEKAILVAAQTPHNSEYFEDILEETKSLIYSAGSEIIKIFIQRRNSLDPATIVGKGKVKEVYDFISSFGNIDVVIFLNDLKPNQERNLREMLKVKVIDRRALILDIFAQRARTREGKMQVELALLNYLLPRLSGLGQVLSRLGGGIGTRGPGETMLETDKRHVRRRIQTLTRQIQRLRSHRERLRQSRHNKGFLTTAIVGYTNSGKSTLLNLLTHQKVDVEDKLFATLDPTVGKVYLGEGVEMLLVDTVGFIRRLPHHLVAAFKATLEEVEEADMIIHLVDISQRDWQEQMEVTTQVLEEMACDNKPTLLIFNKIDLISQAKLYSVKREFPHALFISALNKLGMNDVKKLLLENAKKYFPKFVERYKKRYETDWNKTYTTEEFI